MKQFKLQCGDSVVDKITKAKGIVCARYEALSGNIKILVRPPTAKEGKPADGFWIDEDSSVELVKARDLKANPEPLKRTGANPERMPRER